MGHDQLLSISGAAGIALDTYATAYVAVDSAVAQVADDPPATTTSYYIKSVKTTRASVLDNFNRANGAVGSAWLGDTSNYAIASNTLAVSTGGVLYWNTTFGAEQEASVTLSAIDAGSTEIALLLKGQDHSECSLLAVWYQPRRGSVQVWTCDTAHTWQQQGSDIPVTFAAGDQFGARAQADGTVGVYRNGTLLSSVMIGANWDFRVASGAIGVALKMRAARCWIISAVEC